MDDKAQIKILKQKILLLKRKVASFRLQGRNDSPVSCSKTSAVLSVKEKADCAKIMDGFLQGVITDPVRAGISDQQHFLECLCLLKKQCLRVKASHSQLLEDHQHEQIAISPVQSSDSTLELAPKELPCDQSECVVSKAGTSIIVGMRRDLLIPTPTHLTRPLEITCSELSMNVSDEYYSICDSKAGSSVNRVGSIALTKKGCKMSQNLQTYRGDDCMSYSDRAKVKDIRRLVQKLTFLKQHPQFHSHQPGASALYLQRLQDTEISIRQKLKGLEEQIQEQSNYLMWLENNRASSVQISKEHLVEQHLQKCQTKFEDKLNKLLEKKAKFNQCGPPDKDGSACIRYNKTLVNQKHVQHKQEREPESGKLCHEKLSPKTKPITFKEVVTQEKFKDAKPKLRLCQQQVNHKITVNKGSQNASDNIQSLKESSVQSSGCAQYRVEREHCQEMTNSPAVSITLESLSKDMSCSEVSQSTEKQVKSIENCLIVDEVEKTV